MEEEFDFIHYLETTPGALEEFLEGHEADNKWFWQRAYWWFRLQIFKIKRTIFGKHR